MAFDFFLCKLICYEMVVVDESQEAWPKAHGNIDLVTWLMPQNFTLGGVLSGYAKPHETSCNKPPQSVTLWTWWKAGSPIPNLTTERPSIDYSSIDGPWGSPWLDIRKSLYLESIFDEVRLKSRHPFCLLSPMWLATHLIIKGPKSLTSNGYLKPVARLRAFNPSPLPGWK